MTAHPTLQHDDVSGHLLVLSVAKLWKGGAAAAAALCRHLSLFGMCTFVNDDRLGSMMTRDRKLSREHGPAASETSHRPRRRIVLSRRAPASNWPAGQSIGRRLFSVLPEIQVSSFSSPFLRCTSSWACLAARRVPWCLTGHRHAPLSSPAEAPGLSRGSPLCAGGKTRPLLLAQQRI